MTTKELSNMWWRANSLMADDLKKSSKARLPKEFYGGIQTSNYSAVPENLCQALINYREVCLPDRLYGGRSTQPDVVTVTNNNEPLHKKV